ncbi:MAG TPA: hypothetical protein P5234_07205 [Thermoanaerobaculaceae bacterium]|nr:hypothetical protein [Thermoanaerobaculaceae bacterium]HRS16025.1 hypothetical protein [Thermoanaerobaculaceae bacterium]
MPADQEVSSARPCRRNGPVRRILGALAALALLGLSAREEAWRGSEARSLRELLASTGLDRRQPELAAAILDEPDTSRARLAVARALVHEALDMSSFLNLPPREAALEAGRIGERLELAERLALAVRRERPAAWQAPMLAGAARYLAWSRQGDRRLFTDRRSWEQPLHDAVAAAPAEAEPIRLLAATRLELWPTLAGEDRVAARQILKLAFRDEATARLFLPIWLKVAGSTEEALGVLPGRSETWAAVAKSLAAARDWPAYIEVHRHQQRLHRRELEGQVREIGERLAGGDVPTSQRMAAAVIGAAPLDLEGAELVSRLVGMLPAAALSSGQAGAAWVRWAGERLVRGQKGMPPQVVARLLGWAGQPPPAELALGRLAAGDLAGAELLERRSEDTNLEAWGPYFIAKARLLAAMGDVAAARQSLAQVHRVTRKRPAYLDAAVAVAQRQGGEAALAARAALDAVAAERWPATAWVWEGPRAELEIQLARAVSGLDIGIDLAPPADAVAAVRIDDGPAELCLASAGTRVEIRRTLVPGLHVIAVSSATAGRIAPGEVKVIP